MGGAGGIADDNSPVDALLNASGDVFQITLDKVGIFSVLLNGDDGGGTAAECFGPEGTTAAEEVDDSGAGEIAKGGEDGFFDAICGRADGVAISGRIELHAAGNSGNDSHARTWSFCWLEIA